MSIGDGIDKLLKKAELHREISGLRGDVQLMGNIKSSFEKVKTKINSELESWDSKREEYMGLDLAPDINILNSFEGMAAEQFALDFPPMVTEIEGIAGQMSNVVSEIGNQILKIENYIEELNSKITTLTCQLNAL